MRTGSALVLVSAVLLVTACGGESGDDDSVAIVGGGAAEEAYRQAYTAAWVESCTAAVARIRKDAPGRAAHVKCDQPVEQMEGNTSFDAEQSRVEGGRQGTFDGCAYAWDEAYAASGEVEPRC
jgi:hypothetical protein